ncbi:MAG: hypothetical protein OXI54_04055 [Chloroflexota bacterium]|nr:hypothetical protein [Chloroflexota bacterium]MDE2683302.1 hypothetical protein [Chloroflexota bacterium]
MPSISVTISIEGDPEGSTAALRRIAGVGGAQELSAAAAVSASREAEPDALTPSETPAQMPSRYQRVRENGASATARRQPAPEPPPTPAQRDSHLCNELASNMTDAARRLVAVLAASDADGVTRESLNPDLRAAIQGRV